MIRTLNQAVIASLSFLILSCQAAVVEGQTAKEIFFTDEGSIFSEVENPELTEAQQERLKYLQSEYGSDGISLLNRSSEINSTFSEILITNEFAGNYFNNHQALSGDMFRKVRKKDEETEWLVPAAPFLELNVKQKGLSKSLLSEKKLFDKIADRTSVSVIETSEGLLGTAIVADKKIAIRPIGDGLHAIIDLGKKRFPNDYPDDELEVIVPEGDTEQGKKKRMNELEDVPITPKRSESETKIRVLNVFTENAVKKIKARTNTSPEDYVKSVEHGANLSLAYNDLKFRVESSGVKTVDYEVDLNSESYVVDSERLMSHSDGFLDAVHDLRVTTKSDVVALIVGNGGSCGIAGSIGVKYSTGFVVVREDCGIEQHTYAHEIGHLIGARHNLQAYTRESPSSGTYGHGYYIKKRRWRSIMSYDCEPPLDNEAVHCLRHLQWSTPNKRLETRERTGSKLGFTRKRAANNVRSWEVGGAKLANLFENRALSELPTVVATTDEISDEE